MDVEQQGEVNDKREPATAGSLPPSARWALGYASGGLAVFPVVPRGKTPLTTHGCKDATRDPDRIASWWTRWPAANVGIATGAVSNLAVLDVDGPEGEASLERFAPLPPTVVVITGGGFHFWYRPAGEVRNSARKLGKGLDVRGDGGYVVAPPSLHPNGERYSFASARREFFRILPSRRKYYLATWPDHLSPAANEPLRATESHVRERPKVTGRGNRYATAALERELDAVRSSSVGARNDTLNRAAFALARFLPDVLSAREVADTLLAAAIGSGLTEQEARRTIASGLASRGAA